jgi:uncharacterized membrane protein
MGHPAAPGARVAGKIERGTARVETRIGPDDTWLLWAIMIGRTGLAIWLEQAYRWAARVSAFLLALALAMVLSNVRIVPMKSPAYDCLGPYLVPMALPLLLFRANLLKMVRTTGKLFWAFHLSSLGTIVGAFVATLTLRGRIDQIEHAAGVMTASSLGGSVNFFAVKESYRVSESVASPLLVADNFISGNCGGRNARKSIAWQERAAPWPHRVPTDRVS